MQAIDFEVVKEQAEMLDSYMEALWKSRCYHKVYEAFEDLMSDDPVEFSKAVGQLYIAMRTFQASYDVNWSTDTKIEKVEYLTAIAMQVHDLWSRNLDTGDYWRPMIENDRNNLRQMLADRLVLHTATTLDTVSSMQIDDDEFVRQTCRELGSLIKGWLGDSEVQPTVLTMAMLFIGDEILRDLLRVVIDTVYSANAMIHPIWLQAADEVTPAIIERIQEIGFPGVSPEVIRAYMALLAKRCEHDHNKRKQTL